MKIFAKLRWSVAVALLPQPLSAASPDAAGQRLMLRCQTCHAVTANAPPKVGPNLSKMFGRKAGVLTNYRYSPALAKSGIVWTDATLDKWLIKPSGLVPGTTMAFVGLPNANDRAALTAYLKKVTR
jgi:cytochrome c